MNPVELKKLFDFFANKDAYRKFLQDFDKEAVWLNDNFFDYEPIAYYNALNDEFKQKFLEELAKIA